MNRCASCKWWTPVDEHDSAARVYDVFPRDPETYQRLPGPHDLRFCLSPKLNDNTDTFTESCFPDIDGALVADGSGYVAELMTGPEFGCVNYEPGDGVWAHRECERCGSVRMGVDTVCEVCKANARG